MEIKKIINARCQSLRQSLQERLDTDGYKWDDLIHDLTDEELDAPDIDEDSKMTAWCGEWVYFLVWYDGFMWIGQAPRNPCDYKMFAQGSEYMDVNT
jgi:hypothetical protein